MHMHIQQYGHTDLTITTYVAAYVCMCMCVCVCVCACVCVIGFAKRSLINYAQLYIFRNTILKY